MRISDIFKKVKQPISFEIFPPKGELDIENIKALLNELKTLNPDFVSVTYSAGGSSNSIMTQKIAGCLKKDFSLSSAAHLTCVNSTEEDLTATVKSFVSDGIENVLALRGDKICPKGIYFHATDIIPTLKNSGFCVGASCYPEGHIESESFEQDIRYMKLKQDLGVDYFVSQLFFDNNYFYRFFDEAKKIGINKPITAGVMPFLSKGQIQRMIFMCGSSLPSQIIRLLYKYENDAESLRLAGIEYASEQIYDLLKHGVDGVHFYTMNQPEIAERHLKYISSHGYKRG